MYDIKSKPKNEKTGILTYAASPLPEITLQVEGLTMTAESLFSLN